MKKSKLKFLVVGAGAVGGITAALLRKNGIDVEIVCKYDDYASLVSENGLKVSGVCGEFSTDIPAFASVSQVKNEKDIILLTTKTTDMIKAAQSLISILKKDGFVISLQNGFCEDELGRVSAPVNNAIVNMIHQIEQQIREILVSNFNDPFFDRFR